MPKRLNSAVKRLTLRAKGRTGSNTQPSSESDSSYNPHASLLGLPAEIRNQIYEELADDTTLQIWPTKDRRPPPPVGLLLTCRQIQQEYRPVLLSHAQILITIAEYKFGNLVRVLETLRPKDVDCLKLNGRVWVLLLVGHVPTRDNHSSLKGWIEYRASKSTQPYFGPGRAAAQDLVFEYDVKFLNQIRPPRPMSRYTNGYQMKLDLLRAHLRMYNRLQPSNEDEAPKEELNRMRENVGECVGMFERLHVERSEQRRGSSRVSPTLSNPGPLVADSTASTVAETG